MLSYSFILYVTDSHSDGCYDTSFVIISLVDRYQKTIFKIMSQQYRLIIAPESRLDMKVACATYKTPVAYSIA